MASRHVHPLLFLIFISLPVVRSITCNWTDAILSEGSCFLYYEERLCYYEANLKCESNGGIIATVDTMAQMLAATSKAKDKSYVWIGASDLKEPGQWVWEATGANATIVYSFFPRDNETASNFTFSGHCAKFFVSNDSKGEIFAEDCERLNPFLCMENHLTTTTPLLVSTTEALTNTTATNDYTSNSTTAASTPGTNVKKNGSEKTDFDFLLLLNAAIYVFFSMP